MKKIFTFLLVASMSVVVFAQKKPYNPDANAKQDLQKAIAQAKLENKHVLITIGGNWCPWCRLLDGYVKENVPVKKYIQEKYVTLKINYSKEQKNMGVMQQLEFPNRFGFPVMVVLNEKGERIHTQNSGYLEEGKGYNEKVMLNFLRAWTKEALQPQLYK